MDPNFHSTVLQQPRYFGGEDNTNGGDGDRNEDRGRIRDILNPSRSSTGQGPGTGPPEGRSGMSMPGAFGTVAAPPPAHGPPQTQPPALHHHQPAAGTRSSTFSLRSPTQAPSEYHHPSQPYQQQPPPPPPLSYSANSNGAGPRSILNPPFMPSNSPSSLPAPSLRPPVGLAPPSSSGLHAPHDRTSPLHAPAVYYSRDTRDRDRERDLDREYERDQRRQKSGTGSFYDPTTDITTSTSNNSSDNNTTAKERRVSDTAGSWHNATNTTSANHNVSQLPQSSGLSSVAPFTSRGPSCRLSSCVNFERTHTSVCAVTSHHFCGW
jgi:DNA helicase INO80